VELISIQDYKKELHSKLKGLLKNKKYKEGFKNDSA